MFALKVPEFWAGSCSLRHCDWATQAAKPAGSGQGWAGLRPPCLKSALLSLWHYRIIFIFVSPPGNDPNRGVNACWIWLKHLKFMNPSSRWHHTPKIHICLVGFQLRLRVCAIELFVGFIYITSTPFPFLLVFLKIKPSINQHPNHSTFSRITC